MEASKRSGPETQGFTNCAERAQPFGLNGWTLPVLVWCHSGSSVFSRTKETPQVGQLACRAQKTEKQEEQT